MRRWLGSVGVAMLSASALTAQGRAEPGDSVPAWIYADSNMVKDDPTLTGQFPRGVIVVVFVRTASSEERAAVLSTIDGELVGWRGGQQVGASWTTRYDLVRLRQARTGEAMDRATQLAQRSSSVVMAFIDLQVAHQHATHEH